MKSKTHPLYILIISMQVIQNAWGACSDHCTQRVNIFPSNPHDVLGGFISVNSCGAKLQLLQP